MNRILLAVGLSILPYSGIAQGYPVKPVRVLVGYAPGGASDVTARIVADAATKLLGQSLVVENRPGAAGSIALDLLTRAKPDGYTLTVSPDTSMFLPVIMPSVSYRTETSFQPITVLVQQPILIVVHPAPGWKSVKELIAAAKAHPDGLIYALPGPTGTQAVVGGLFFKSQGLKMQSVVYKGGGQAVIDLIGGQVPVAVLGSPPVMPHVKSGRLRVLANTAGRRSRSLPDIPTLSESGYSGYDVSQWFGVVAPAGLPADLLARLSSVFLKVLADPAVDQRLAGAGLDPVGGTPEEFVQRLRTEVHTWARAAKELGLRLD